MTSEEILAVVDEMIVKDDLTEYKDALTKKAEDMKAAGTEIDLNAVCAALIKYTLTIKNKADAKAAKRAAKAAAGDDADSDEQNNDRAADDSTSSVQRFFINVGEHDGLYKEDLMKFVEDNFKDITDDDFSDVYLKDTFSFFELPKAKIEGLIDALNGKELCDREVNVEFSEKKPARSGGRGGFGGGRGGFGGGSRGGYRGGSRGGFGGGRGGFGGGRGGYSRGGDDRRSSYGDRGGRGGYGGGRGGYSGGRSSYGDRGGRGGRGDY